MSDNRRFTERDSIEARRRRAEARKKSETDIKKITKRNWLIAIAALGAALAFFYFGK